MGVFYLAALIVGGGISLLQLVMSSGDGDADSDVNADAHVDGDTHIESVSADAEPGAIAHALHGTAAAHAPGGGGGLATVLLSLRFWTFGLLGFGLVGTLLTYLHLASAQATSAVSTTVGLVSGFGASWVLRALGRATTDSGGDSLDLLGQTGRVLIEVQPKRPGKVRIQVRGRTCDCLATCDEETLGLGELVLVEAVEGDMVRVGRLPDELRALT